MTGSKFQKQQFHRQQVLNLVDVHPEKPKMNCVGAFSSRDRLVPTGPKNIKLKNIENVSKMLGAPLQKLPGHIRICFSPNLSARFSKSRATSVQS